VPRARSPRSNGLIIAYVTIGAADDIHEWSGLNASIRQALVNQGCVVHKVDRLGTAYPISERLKRRLYPSVLGRVYAPERNVGVARRWADQASRRIEKIEGLDAIVSTGCLPIAYLSARVSKAMWADATFHALRGAYPEHTNYARASIAGGDRIERAALNSVSLACFASAWAADDATSFYGAPAETVKVVPFGANDRSPFATEDEAAAHVHARDHSVLRFLFIGVDWERKGGPIAMATVRRLNAIGIPSHLTVIGCSPAIASGDRDFATSLGFLSKKVPADAERIHAALRQSHFLLLPTTAECFGLVFAEASAFALPSIAQAVGGVPTAVKDGVTGRLLPPGSGAGAYVDALMPLIHDSEAYRRMSMAAYHDHATRLNWQVAGRHFVSELAAVVDARRGAR